MQGNPILFVVALSVAVLVVLTMVYTGGTPEPVDSSLDLPQQVSEKPPGRPVAEPETDTWKPSQIHRSDARTDESKQRDPGDGVPETVDSGADFAKGWSYSSIVGDIVSLDFGNGSGLHATVGTHFLGPAGVKARIVEIRSGENLVIVRREADGQLAEVTRSPSSPVTVVDTFSGERLDGSVWVIPDGKPLVANGALELHTANGELQRLERTGRFSGRDGDVSAEVVYRNFSANPGGSELGLRMFSHSPKANFTAWMNVATWSGNQPFEYNFVLDHPDGTRTVWAKIPTSARSGRLRLVYLRDSGMIEGYYDDGNGWKKAGDTSRDPSPLDVSYGIQFDLRAWCDTEDGQSIEFDDFSVQGFPYAGPLPGAAP
jgi:hypothetical protein